MTAYLDPAMPAKRRGFTLTEMAIVLGVIGAILGAIWWVSWTTQEQNKINQAFQELQAVSQGVISLQNGRPFSSFGVPGAVTMLPTLIAANVIPSWAVLSPTTARTPWAATGFGGGGGSSLNLWPATATTFLVSFYNVPKDACIALLTQATNCQAGHAACPIEVYTAYTDVAPTAIDPDPTVGWQILNPEGNALAACAANPPAGEGQTGNSVEFWYSL